MPPLANAVIFTTPVVTAADDDTLDTDDDERLDETLLDDTLLGAELLTDVVTELDTDERLLDMTLLTLLGTLLEDTGVATLVYTLSSPGLTITLVPSLKVTFLALIALGLYTT